MNETRRKEIALDQVRSTLDEKTRGQLDQAFASALADANDANQKELVRSEAIDLLALANDAAKVLTPIARGDRPATIILHYVLRNAAIPVLTVSSSFLGYLLGGAVIVEVLFSIPGVGLYVYNALNNRDYAVVQAGVMISALVFVGINAAVDIAYALIDPRVGNSTARARSA